MCSTLINTLDEIEKVNYINQKHTKLNWLEVNLKPVAACRAHHYGWRGGKTIEMGNSMGSFCNVHEGLGVKMKAPKQCIVLRKTLTAMAVSYFETSWQSETCRHPSIELCFLGTNTWGTQCVFQTQEAETVYIFSLSKHHWVLQNNAF